MYPTCYLHDSRSRAKSAIYIAAGCQHKIVIYTAAIQEPNLLYARLSCISIYVFHTGIYVNNHFIRTDDSRVYSRFGS